MPLQEIFHEEEKGPELIQIIKTYDLALARESFDHMDSAALDHLANSLSIEQQFEQDEIPDSPYEHEDFLWNELLESAREDGQRRSFFVVTRASIGSTSFLYVSGDWPSAERYLRRLAPE